MTRDGADGGGKEKCMWEDGRRRRREEIRKEVRQGGRDEGWQECRGWTRNVVKGNVGKEGI